MVVLMGTPGPPGGKSFCEHQAAPVRHASVLYESEQGASPACVPPDLDGARQHALLYALCEWQQRSALDSLQCNMRPPCLPGQDLHMCVAVS